MGSPTDLNRHPGADSYPGTFSHSLRKPIHDFSASSQVSRKPAMQSNIRDYSNPRMKDSKPKQGPSLGGNEFFDHSDPCCLHAGGARSLAVETRSKVAQTTPSLPRAASLSEG